MCVCVLAVVGFCCCCCCCWFVCLLVCLFVLLLIPEELKKSLMLPWLGVNLMLLDYIQSGILKPTGHMPLYYCVRTAGCVTASLCGYQKFLTK